MVVGFGLGRLHHIVSRRTRERVVRSAMDAGFRHFDLAPAYGDGLVEREVGRILGRRRGEVQIATKFGIPFRRIGELPAPVYLAVRAAGKALRTSFGAQYDRRDFSRTDLLRSLEGSLRRLRTDYIDLLLVHEPLSLDQYRALDDSWEELERQKQLGRIRKFGVSGGTRLLLDAEQAGLIPTSTTRMIPMNELTCALEQSWFREREVFVFNIVKYLRRRYGPARIETDLLFREFFRALPSGRPIVASCNLDEIERMGRAVAGLSNSGATRGVSE